MANDIIVVGGANIDLFITTKSKDVEIERIHTHEDVCLPIGAKILIDTLVTDTGGAGLNTATAFARLGLKTAVISKLGQDINADIILNKLKKEKIEFLGVKAPGSTGCSIILSGLKENRTILTYKGNNNKLTTRDIQWKKLNSKWLYFGTLMGESWKTQCQIATYARKKGIKLLFNPSLYLAEKGMNFLKPVLDACTILVLNKEEAQALTGIKDAKKVIRKLQEKVPIVVVTDGDKGATAYNGIDFHSIVPKKTHVVDTTGAGDSFASAFLAAIIDGQDIPTALKWGVAEARSVIQHFGATNILLTKKEIMRELK